MTDSPEFRIWSGMKRRCGDEKNKDYGDYGGRGISVCDEWRNSFPAFFAYIGERPSMQHSVDRIDNDKGYEPGNVRWATRDVQCSNRRTTVRINYAGLILTLREWSAITGLKVGTLRSRLEYGKTPEQILTRRLHENKGVPKLDDETVASITDKYEKGSTVREIAAHFGLSRGTVQNAIKGNVPIGVKRREVSRPLLPPHPTGEQHVLSKLTTGQVIEIRLLWERGEDTLAEIGSRYGVSGVLVGLIGKRKVWKHIP